MFRASCLTVLLAWLMLPVVAWPQQSLNITSSSFVDGKIAQRHACGGQGGDDISPQITVSGLPVGSAFLAIVMDDPDAMAPAGKVWVHWNVVNIPAASLSFAAGAKPAGEQLRNSGGGSSYAGMCPPDGVHVYRLAVFALKEKLDTGGFFGPSDLTIERFVSEYGDRILASKVIKGKF